MENSRAETTGARQPTLTENKNTFSPKGKPCSLQNHLRQNLSLPHTISQNHSLGKTDKKLLINGTSQIAHNNICTHINIQYISTHLPEDDLRQCLVRQEHAHNLHKTHYVKTIASNT